MRKLPIGVLISGAGTNLRAIIDQCENGTLDADVRIVISNREGAAGLEHSRTRGIPTLAFPRSPQVSREEQQRSMAAKLTERGVELVVLAGFDQILSDEFVEQFSFKMVNLHPSL